MTDLFLETLNIELPIIQAPMAGVQGSALAAAVSSAGALGSLACAMLDAQTVRSEMKVIRARTTKPVNLNFFCHTVPSVDVQQEAKWRSQLGQYYRQYGIDTPKLTAGAVRAPFTESSMDLLEELAPAVDAIIAQGSEAGGHRGMFLSADLTTQMGTLPSLMYFQGGQPAVLSIV